MPDPEQPELVIRASLLDLIRDGLGQDGRLPTERDLSRRFAIGRRTVRRALEEMEADGLIWRRQGKGTFAGRPKDTASRLAAEIMDGSNSVEVMEARLCIEPELAALAAIRALPDDLLRLRHLAHRRFDPADSRSTEIWDSAFHGAIAAAARNRPLLTAFAALDEIRSNLRWRGMRQRARSTASLEETMAQHMTIYAAIQSGAAEEARRAMHDHIRCRLRAMLHELADKGDNR